MAGQWVDVEVPDKFFKFSKPGQVLEGIVKAIKPDGMHGPEITFDLGKGRETILSCSATKLTAWASSVEVGQKWRIRFEGQGEAVAGKDGKKHFSFQGFQTLPKGTAKSQEPPVRERDPGEDDDYGDPDAEPSPFRDEEVAP